MQDHEETGDSPPDGGAIQDDATRMSNAKASPGLTALAAMPRPDLARLWQDLFRRPAPTSMSTALMLRFLAFELQARNRGGLAEGFVAALERQVGGDQTRLKTVSSRLRPGGRLLREWSGTTHVVDITDTGFLWRGKPWASLSAIAQEITGAHWSGPRFFGLTDAAQTRKPRNTTAAAVAPENGGAKEPPVERDATGGAA